MTPTRDKTGPGPFVDTGVGSPVAERSDVWEYAGPPDVPGADSGIGSPVAARADLLDGVGGAGHAVPPLWL